MPSRREHHEAPCHTAKPSPSERRLWFVGVLFAPTLLTMTTANSDHSTNDVMSGPPCSFDFIDYLCATRGIDREAALVLVGEYMMARSADAQRELGADAP